MMVQLILPIIACIFIVLACIQMAAARRNDQRQDDSARIAVNVRKRLARVYVLVGVGLLGLFWFLKLA